MSRRVGWWVAVFVVAVPISFVAQGQGSKYITMPGLSGAEALDALASEADSNGDRHEAFWLEEEALSLAVQRLEPHDFRRAGFLLRQARYADLLGLSDLSYSYYTQGVALYEATRVDDGLILALLSLARLDEQKGAPAEARVHAERAVQACSTHCRGEDKATLRQMAYDALAAALHRLGQLDAAEDALQEALRDSQPSLYSSAIVARRAEILIARREYRPALRMLLQLPEGARDANLLAQAQAGLNDMPAAVSTLRRASEKWFRESTLLASEIDGPTGEAPLVKAVANHPWELGTAISLDEEYGDGNADLRNVVATTVLNRVGLASDVVARMFLRLRREVSAQDAAQLREMFRLRSQVALWVRHYGQQRAGAESRIREYGRRAREIEIALLHKHGDAVGDIAVASLRELAARLPPDTALVQIVKYIPPTGPAKYRAYVLHRDAAVHATTLGEALGIESVAQEFRQSLVNSLKSSPKVRLALSKQAGKALWDPIAGLVSEKNVMLVPDAGLLATSFEALFGRDGFVGDAWGVTYLSSARELQRRQQPDRVPVRPPVVFANPAFGAGDATTIGRWDPLAETARDATAIKARRPDSEIRLERDASTAALRAAASPLFLHIGSHAYYSPIAERRVGVLVEDAVEPMLAAGVVLAGANLPDIDDDGIVSAVDFAGMDLRGTELVFISACSSGEGTVRDGEGMYGIRRGLQIAGSRAQILALWPVDRDATSEFVRAFYAAWPGSGSLRLAQKAAQRHVRSLSAHKGWKDDPFYWGAFVLSGTFRP